MPKYKLRGQDGSVIEVEGRRFSYYIGNIQHWFIVHLTPGSRLQGYVVSEKETGFRVSEIGHLTLSTCLGDEVAAAKMTLDKLLARVGAARFKEALKKAKTQLEELKEAKTC